MAIVLRSVKGSPLTISEVDGNFTTLDQGKLDKTGGTSLYLGTGANSTRFPNALTVISNTASGIQQNEPHNAGLISEGTGSSLTTTISGTLGAMSIVVGSATGIMIGQLITGTGIAPNATVTNIVSTTITVSVANTGTVSGTGTFSNIGVGVYGVGYTAGAARSGGVVGEGHVSGTGDTASAIGVRGYAHDTHAGGLNIGLYGDAANGSSSYALYLNRGNIYSAGVQTWSLNGNLTFSGAYTVTIPTLSLSNALPIASGGTGATSAAAALTALGAYASSNPSGYTSNAGTVTSVGGTAPISSSGGTAPTISISQSSSGSNGYLSSTDWNSFNGKQSAIGTISGLAKGNGANALTSATAGTDYVAPGGALGTPTSGTLSSCTVDGTNGVGYINIPQNSQSAAYTLVAADAGKHIFHPSTDATARTFTIPANSSVTYPVGTAISFVNMTSQVVSIAITTDTMYLAGTGTTGTRSLAQYGTATALKIESNKWIISGAGLT